MSITLTPEQERVVRDRLKTGAYRDEHEVIDDALARFVEDDLEREVGVETVKSAIGEGTAQLRRGEGVTITDKEAFADGVMARSKRLLAARKSSKTG